MTRLLLTNIGIRVDKTGASESTANHPLPSRQYFKVPKTIDVISRDKSLLPVTKGTAIRSLVKGLYKKK